MTGVQTCALPIYYCIFILISQCTIFLPCHHPTSCCFKSLVSNSLSSLFHFFLKHLYLLSCIFKRLSSSKHSQLPLSAVTFCLQKFSYQVEDLVVIFNRIDCTQPSLNLLFSLIGIHIDFQASVAIKRRVNMLRGRCRLWKSWAWHSSLTCCNLIQLEYDPFQLPLLVFVLVLCIYSWYFVTF